MRTNRLAPRRRIPASEESRAQKVDPRVTAANRGDLGEAAFLHKVMRLGLVVAKPWGNTQRYDFVVEGRRTFWRVQVKTGSYMMDGLYQVCVRRRTGTLKLAYSESELDFVAAYIIPEDTWYVVPVREVTGRTALLFPPRGSSRLDRYAHYREAWHLLRQPDGLVFG